MIRFWDFKLSRAPPLLSFIVRRPGASVCVLSSFANYSENHDSRLCVCGGAMLNIKREETNHGRRFIGEYSRRNSGRGVGRFLCCHA